MDYMKTHQAKTTIFGSISRDEAGRVLHCASPDILWRTLENYHEGSEEVRDEKKYAAIFEYETFKRKEGEDITTMTNRLLALVS